MNKLIAPFAALAFAFSMATAHADEAVGTIAGADSTTLIRGAFFWAGHGPST